MNQQHSRRFQAAKESADKVQEIARITQKLKDRGADVPLQNKQFDQNCITPVNLVSIASNSLVYIIECLQVALVYIGD